MSGRIVAGANGGGQLNRGGRPRGAKALVTKTFEEFANATLADPDVRLALKARLLDELAGVKSNPLPCLAVLAAASVRQKASPTGPGTVVFVAEILGGRGHVERVELDVNALPRAAETLSVPEGA